MSSATSTFVLSVVAAVSLLGAAEAGAKAKSVQIKTGAAMRLDYRKSKALVRAAWQHGGKGTSGLKRLLTHYKLVYDKPQQGGPSQYFDGWPSRYPRVAQFHKTSRRFGRRFGVSGAMSYMLDSSGNPTGDGFHDLLKLKGLQLMIGMRGGVVGDRQTLDLGRLGKVTARRAGAVRWIVNPTDGKALSQGFHWIHRDLASGQLIGVERTWTTTGKKENRRFQEGSPRLFLLHPSTYRTLGRLIKTSPLLGQERHALGGL